MPGGLQKALQQLALLVLAAVCCTATAHAGTTAASRQLRVDFGITESYYSETPAPARAKHVYNTLRTDAAEQNLGGDSILVSRRLQEQSPLAALLAAPPVPAAPLQPQPTGGNDSSLLAVPFNGSTAATNKYNAGPQNVQLLWPPYDFIQQQLQQLDSTDNQQQAAKKFSVVIMNWSRPENTKKIAEAYTTDPAYEPYVAEVLVLHLKPDVLFELDNPKVKHYVDYTANEKYGLAVRFIGCLLATESEVLMQDDDAMVRPNGMKDLLAARAAGAPGQLVGFRGRTWNRMQEPYYSPKEALPGMHPIVLTIAVATPKPMCAAFFKYAPAVEDLVVDAKPYWNGEDIFLSLVAYKLTCVMPRIMKGGWPEKSASALQYIKDETDVGMHKVFGKEHFQHRRRFVRIAARRLGIYQPGRQADGCGSSIQFASDDDDESGMKRRLIETGGAACCDS